MPATLSINGKPQRKQLSDQLDRMDGIIDCLADALPDAVADACRDGARQAVKDAVIEIVTNPELRTLISGLAPEAKPKTDKPSLWSRVRSKLAAARSAVSARIATIKNAILTRCVAVITTVTIAVQLLSTLLAMKKILLVGIGVGIVACVIGYVCPHGLSAMLGGIAAAATTIVAQLRGWFRRSTT